MKSKITKFMAVLTTALLLFTVLPLTAIRSSARTYNYRYKKYSFTSGSNNSKWHSGIVVYPVENMTTKASILLHGYTSLEAKKDGGYGYDEMGGYLTHCLSDATSNGSIDPTVVVVPFINHSTSSMDKGDYLNYVIGNDLSDLMNCILSGKFEDKVGNLYIDKSRSIDLAGWSMGSSAVMYAAEEYKNMRANSGGYLVKNFGLLSPNDTYLDYMAERYLGQPWENVLRDRSDSLYYVTTGKNEWNGDAYYPTIGKEYAQELSRSNVLKSAKLYCEYIAGRDSYGYYGDSHKNRNLFCHEFVRFLSFTHGKSTLPKRIKLFPDMELNTINTYGGNCPYSDNIERFVWNLYINILHRNPNNIGKDEINYHAYHLRYCGYTACDTIRVFLESYEFQNLVYPKLSNADFVESLYNGLLGRQSDASGKKAWTREHTYNPDRRSAYSMFKGFTDSQEFKNRFNNTGISAGVL